MYIFDKELFREDYLRMGKPKHKLDFHLLGWVAKVDGKEVKFKKGEDKDKDLIKLNCSDLLNGFKDRIKSVEIYFNPYTTNIDCSIEGAKLFNIFTKQEV